MEGYFSVVAAWLNGNQGVLGFVIFCTTLIFGWLSGIFSALRRRPKFSISTIAGPTYCCTYEIGKVLNGFAAHRTGIVLYLSVANVGSSPSSIGRISVGYHWDVRPFTMLWFRYGLGWFWLKDQTVALEDFKIDIDSSVKYFPFLIQQSSVSSSQVNTYLEVGCAVNGVVYFEQNDSWGGCRPRIQRGTVFLKIKVEDVFGGAHKIKVRVPVLSIDEARAFNSSFGLTFETVRGDGKKSL